MGEIKRSELEQHPQVGRWIDGLRKFLKEPQPGERPIAYIATRQANWEYPDRDPEKPKLYRVDDLDVNSFMAEVYPEREYMDYRDLAKAEQYTMPGFDLYVEPIELERQDLGYDFIDQAGAAFGSLLSRPNWEEVINSEASQESKNPDSDVADMLKGMGESMQVLGPVFANSGPLDLPQYHVSTAIALDSYAPGWLEIDNYQIESEDSKKTIPERFNEKYANLGLRYGRMLTVRYKSYKPGLLNAVTNQLTSAAMTQLGYVPEQMEENMGTMRDKVLELQDLDEVIEYKKTNKWPDRESGDLVEYLKEFVTASEMSDETREIAVEVIKLAEDWKLIEEDLLKKAQELYEQFTLTYFGMTSEEFESAYHRRIQWLVEKSDEAIIDFAHRIGLTPMFKRALLDDVWGHPVTTEDFVSGGVLMKETFDERIGGNTRMVMAYPVDRPLEDRPYVSSYQVEKSLDEIRRSSNGRIFVAIDCKLNKQVIRIIERTQRCSQYTAVKSTDVLSGQVNADVIEDSVEVVYLLGYPKDVSERKLVDEFIKGVYEKVTRSSRKPAITPAVLVLDYNLPNFDKEQKQEWQDGMGTFWKIDPTERDVTLTQIK